MRPSGDGDRDISRKASGSFGDKRPLEALPLVDGGEAGIIGLDRRFRVERLGVEAGGLRDLPDPELCSDSSEGCCRRTAERVTGAKYPSRASDLSEKEGDGEMTRGVSGTSFGVEGILEDRMAKGGSAGMCMRPNNGRVQVIAASQARLPQGIDDLPNDLMMSVRDGIYWGSR